MYNISPAELSRLSHWMRIFLLLLLGGGGGGWKQWVGNTSVKKATSRKQNLSLTHTYIHTQHVILFIYLENIYPTFLQNIALKVTNNQ